MCRLFGLAAGREPVKATFWLLEAPDSLAELSRRNPDGYGPAMAQLESGELVHVDRGLQVTCRIAIDRPAALQLRLEDLLPKAAASQHHSAAPESAPGREQRSP